MPHTVKSLYAGCLAAEILCADTNKQTENFFSLSMLLIGPGQYLRCKVCSTMIARGFSINGSVMRFRADKGEVVVIKYFWFFGHKFSLRKFDVKKDNTQTQNDTPKNFYAIYCIKPRIGSALGSPQRCFLSSHVTSNNTVFWGVKTILEKSGINIVGFLSGIFSPNRDDF